MSTEARMARDALYWTLMCAGGLLLVAHLNPALVVASGAPEGEGASRGYLSLVFGRSLGQAYQLAMLAGWAAILPHAVWTLLRAEPQEASLAYDRFGLWAQTVFTSLGFLGTIIGVSQAVGGLRAAMANQEPGALIAGLAVAFDTTFIGLGAALTLMFLRKIGGLAWPEG